jgi:hypothetical protein
MKASFVIRFSSSTQFSCDAVIIKNRKHIQCCRVITILKLNFHKLFPRLKISARSLKIHAAQNCKKKILISTERRIRLRDDDYRMKSQK